MTKKSIILLTTFYIFVWTIAPTLIASSVALDVSEGINWGSEFQWGYYKHPPLSSWVLYVFYTSFASIGLGAFGVYLLSQLCVFTTLICNYQLSKKAFSNEVGVIASILTMGIFYYTYPTLEFNHNIAQFPIWSGLSLAFYLAVTENKWSHWIWVAILGGLGMLTKYSVIFLLLPMALYLLYPKNWHLLKSIKPWLSACLMLLIFAPHLVWLVNNEWLPLSYAQGRGHNESWVKSHFSWISFTLAQILVHLPLLIIVLWLRKHLIGAKDYWQTININQKILWYLWLSPLVVLSLLSLLFGIKLRDMWGMPMWGLSALLIASMFQTSKLQEIIQKSTKGIIIWLTIISTLMIIYLSFGHQLRDKPSRMDWNEQAIAIQANTTWQKHSSCALDSLSGDRWLTALVALHSKNDNNRLPSQIFTGGANKSPWMSTERITKHGTMLLWQDDDKPDVELLNSPEINSLTTIDGKWEIPWTKNLDAEPLTISWSLIIPPECIR